MSTKNAYKVLVIDDEKDIRDLLTYNLKQAGYLVDTAKNGKDGIKKCLDMCPDLIILDIMMPEQDGVETCREIRETHNLKNVIILFLTARSEEYSEIAAFDAGADDFITKPIRQRVLLSRIKAAFRRKNKPQHHVQEDNSEVLDFGTLQIHPDNYSVTQGEKEINFAKKEYKLLLFLAQNPDKLFTREELLDNIWGKDVYVSSRTVDVHIRKIREKLGNEYIFTKKGIGYKFQVPEPNSQSQLSSV